MLSPLHYIHNIYTPVHKSFTLSIKPDSIPAGKKSKMLIIKQNGNQELIPFNSTWSGEYLTAEVRSFGRYYAGIDTIAPVISANGLTEGAVLTGKKELRIRITDELSGINYYQPLIDGRWALFEYDQKNNIIIYRFDAERITRDNRHKLSLTVADNKDNISRYECSFTW